MNFNFLKEIYVQKLFRLFNNAGAQLYVVGGAVRDTFLGKEFNDVDFATDMLPQDVVDLLASNKLRHDAPGLEYGTVRTFFEDKKYEISTLRKDKYEHISKKTYKDRENDKIRKKLYSRYPTVQYTNDPFTDARRRDFTCNSIYVNQNSEIIDPFNGIEDIQNGVVKFIGNPLESVDVDPFRILRYFRLCAESFYKNFDETALTVCMANFDRAFYINKRKFLAEYSKIMACRNRFIILNLWEKYGILNQIEEFVKITTERIEEEDKKRKS